jgi:putative phosphoribosyl transferase
MIFHNRALAGEELAKVLKKYKNKKNTIVLGLPRGGIVVADKVAAFLNLPLDLVVPRKIGAPMNPEYAIGAITEEGEGIFNEEEIKTLDISEDYLKKEVESEKKEAERRLKKYRGDRPPLDLKNKTVIIVDDGIATGLTIRAAIKTVKKMGANKIVVAIPVSAQDSLEKIKGEVDEVVCLKAPMFFGAVGAFFEEFLQTEDKEVVEIMKNF